MLWLFIYAFLISLYDWRTHRIPNWATLPIVLAGVLMRFPGSFDLWLASLTLLLAWGSNWMGGGDVKLWLAILWALPAQFSAQTLPWMFATFFLTSLLQMGWRLIRKQMPTGSAAPAAWRTVPFVLICWYVH